MMKKYTVVLLFLSSVFVACSDAGKTEENTGDEETATEPVDPKMAAEMGKTVYTQHCQLCHGADGKMGASGAKDLSVSALSEQDAKNVVTYGRGGMVSYKEILTKDQIKNVVAYIQTLRKK